LDRDDIFNSTAWNANASNTMDVIGNNKGVTDVPSNGKVIDEEASDWYGVVMIQSTNLFVSFDRFLK
jgi:hypothetical protein